MDIPFTLPFENNGLIQMMFTLEGESKDLPMCEANKVYVSPARFISVLTLLTPVLREFFFVP